MVKHILKDGQTVQDIKGHVVREKDVPIAYAILEQERKRKKDDSKHC